MDQDGEEGEWEKKIGRTKCDQKWNYENDCSRTGEDGDLENACSLRTIGKRVENEILSLRGREERIDENDGELIQREYDPDNCSE